MTHVCMIYLLAISIRHNIQTDGWCWTCLYGHLYMHMKKKRKADRKG